MPRKLKTPLALRPRTFPAAVSTIGSLTAPPTLSGSAMCWRPGRRATLEERLERGNGQTVTAPDPSRGDGVDVVESAPGFGSRPEALQTRILAVEASPRAAGLCREYRGCVLVAA